MGWDGMGGGGKVIALRPKRNWFRISSALHGSVVVVVLNDDADADSW